MDEELAVRFVKLFFIVSLFVAGMIGAFITIVVMKLAH